MSHSEQCWAGQKEYMRFLRLIKSSSSIFALFFPQSDERLQDSHVPQDQIALLLYCFIFILLINTAKELLFFFVEKHELFVIALTLLYIIKNLENYLLVISSPSPISAFTEIPDCNLQFRSEDERHLTRRMSHVMCHCVFSDTSHFRTHVIFLTLSQPCKLFHR